MPEFNIMSVQYQSPADKIAYSTYTWQHGMRTELKYHKILNLATPWLEVYLVVDF